MPKFAYKALAPAGNVVTGVLSAASRDAAIATLRNRNVAPVEVAERTAAKRRLWVRKRATERDLMLFTRQLAILHHAGAPLDDALAKLDLISGAGPLDHIPAALLADIRAGAAFSDALAAHPDVFPAFYPGMVRAGEAGGAVAGALDRLGDMLERAEALKETLRSALTYPLLVFGLTGVSLVILLVLVVPEFRAIFENAGATPPLATRIVLAASDFAAAWGGLTLAGLGAGGLALARYAKTAKGRARLDGAALSVPLLGDLIRKVETARFCRTLGALRVNGVTLVEGVEVAAGALRNTAAATAITSVRSAMTRGEGLAMPMRATGLFPELALQLIATGEESGRLEQMLLQVADVYDVEVERTVQRLLALLTPAVTIILGVMIAFVIGAILSAILGSYDIAFV